MRPNCGMDMTYDYTFLSPLHRIFTSIEQSGDGTEVTKLDATCAAMKPAKITSLFATINIEGAA